ncbi:DUF4365 domain-containing protein [Nonomuraea ceibae]|uniref:DUF4365 domain-containing protein n=1 Tax=Nonomuraea ceibae TaxID=1935170 RepID=UPI001C5D20CB|nr:DUF4365 domain-containing protein [Nonomuraea ceibae]
MAVAAGDITTDFARECLDGRPCAPILSEAHKIGGQSVLAARVGGESSLKWIFRKQPEDDYGVDTHLEIAARDYGTPRRLRQTGTVPSCRWRPSLSGWLPPG